MSNQVTFRYTDGRENLPPSYRIEIGAERVQEMLDRGDPIEVTDGAELVKLPETIDPPPEDEPKTETAPKGDKRDGWPDGYSFLKKGTWVTLSDPDGKAVKSESKSGKFKGEDAAQEAAWLHREAQG